MIGATNDEIRSSLAAHEELRCDDRRLYLANAQVPSITINLRVKEPHQLVYLARLVAHIGYEEIHFRGAYLWITTWGVWNTQDEAIGFKTLEQFRRSYGENRSLEAAAGNYFRDDEFTESVCCLLQPMMVGWDAYYVPRWAYGHLDYFVSVSHDGFIDIEVRTQEMRDKALEILGHEMDEGSVEILIASRCPTTARSLLP
jgi:hypothetical protein